MNEEAEEHALDHGEREDQDVSLGLHHHVEEGELPEQGEERCFGRQHRNERGRPFEGRAEHGGRQGSAEEHKSDTEDDDRSPGGRDGSMEPAERICVAGRRRASHHEYRADHGHEQEHPREHGRCRVETGLDTRQSVLGEQEIQLGDEDDACDRRDRRAEPRERGDGRRSGADPIVYLATKPVRSDAEGDRLGENDRDQDAGEARAQEHEQDSSRDAGGGACSEGDRHT